MKFFSALVALALGAAFVPNLSARPTITISRPAPDSTFHVGQMFTVAGQATPADKVASIRLRVAGQRLVPIGTGRWKVSVGIGKPGRYRITVASKIGNKVVAKVQRYVQIVP